MSACYDSLCEIIEEKYVNDKGVTVTKQYQKGRFLGKGGFAKCYEFKELNTGKYLAAKIIEKSSLNKGRAKQKLASEIKIHKSMNHPGVVKFESTFEDANRVYIMLELCSNQTLKEVVKRRKKLHEIEAQCYLKQIVPALQHIQNAGVIHRDLKLGNLFLTKGMEIKVGDFGLAAKLDFKGEKRRTVCGTPNYIAPEVLESKTLGHSFEADIWSLGVILYTMLIGKPPFETENVKTTYKKIKANDYHIPDDANISDAAAGLIHRILVLNPAKRPSLNEIMDDRFMTKNAIPRIMPLITLTNPPSNEFIKQYTEPKKNTHSSQKDLKTINKINSWESTAPTACVIPTKTSVASSININTIRPPTSGTISIPKAQLKTNNFVAQTNRQPKENTSISRKNSQKTLQKPPSQVIIKQSINTPNLEMYATSRPFSSQASIKPLEGPAISIDFYLDYTDKYGVGYVLTNGVIGFNFNDLTNLILLEKKGQYAYNDFYQPNQTPTVKYYPINDYPKEIEKKVKIIGHFISYFNKTREEAGNVGSLPELGAGEYVAIKQFVKTKNGLFVRLTNSVVQMFFSDKTQLMLCMKKKNFNLYR